MSTAPDQIAIAPGYLQHDSIENGRRVFVYHMDVPILNFYSIQSARYAVRHDHYKGVAIDVYYHPGHEYDIDRMIAALSSFFGALATLLAAIGLGAYALTSGAPERRDCVTVTFASTLGGAELNGCGSKARRICASGQFHSLSEALATACRRAGFPFRAG